MRNTLLILCGTFFLVTFSVQAQDQDEQDNVRDPKAVEKIQNLRIAYISEKLALTPDQAQKFWPLYHEFVQKRGALRKELKTAQRSIDPNNADPQKQKQLLDLSLNLRQKELDLEKEYSGRLLTVINAEQVLNLRKAEQDFRTMIINQLQQRRMMQQRKEMFRDENQRLRQKTN